MVITWKLILDLVVPDAELAEKGGNRYQYDLARYQPNFDGKHPERGSGAGASHLFSPSTKLARGLVARQLFRVPPCRKGTTHFQIFISSPGQALLHISQRR
ncbi:hypothetical protein TNCV_3580681 [Trichonephila clavipes]|nr:hypothetical protein TNCV_3580681 [Trichonephila clavipes]